MIKMTAMVLVVLLMLFILVGCGTTPEEKVYGKDDVNIEVKAGESFVIQLEENPTTGYEWTVTISDEDIVKLTDDQYNTEVTDEDIVGAGGTHAYTFKTLVKGAVQITFVYERSFEENSAVETIVYNVTVK